MLTMLGIVIGVAAVIVMVAVGYGARSRIHEQINNLGTNMIVITPGASTSGGVSQGAQAFATLTLADADKIRNESQTVVAVSPVIIGRSQVIAAGGNWRTAINGVDTDYQTIRDWQTDAGAFFGPDDVRAARGRGRARPHGGSAHLRRQRPRRPGDPGRRPSLQGDGRPGAEGTDRERQRFRRRDPDPLHDRGDPADGRDRASRRFSPAPPRKATSRRRRTRSGTLLRESHHIIGDDEDDFTVRNQTDLATAAESSTRVMTMLMAAIASISLLVGGIGIMNIMLVSVTERTREIGIRLAIGARGSDVLMQFLVESIVMGILGGVAGLVLGITSAKVLAHFTGWETVISPLVMVVAVGFSGGVGVFFGYYPARKAAALNPIEALRYE